MSKRLPIFFALVPVALAIVFQSSGALRTHLEATASAPGIQAKFTVTPVGGSAEEHTISLVKPNKIRWESPSKLVVSDGSKIWTYDKSAKTYTEDAAPEANTLLANDNLWLWGAHFDPKFAEQIGSAVAGKTRRIKIGLVKEVEVKLSKRTGTGLTVFVDEKTNIARGALWKSTASDGTTKETIITVEELKMDAAPDAGMFTFVAPAGASKVDKAAVATVTYKEINRILMGNCAGCHGSQGGRAGFSVTSYQSLMAGRRGQPVIVPGDSKNSPIMRNLTGQSRVMPPNGRMPQNVIDTIAAWIDAGAKND